MNLISIIIPVYNAARYLNRCIRSVIEQTHADLEIILVDDGSNDGSLQLCKEWSEQDKRIRVISQFNQGVSSARNTGLSNAKGSYIMFLDSDDCMKPEMCAVMLAKMQKSDMDMVVCGTEENDGMYWKPQRSTDYSTLEGFKLDFIKLLQTELLSPPWNKLYKKEKITSEFPEDVSFGEDLIFNLSYLKNCQRISFITDILHFHEKENENSLARKTDFHRLTDIEQVQSAVLDFMDSSVAIPELYAKYAKDIACYGKTLILTPNFTGKGNLTILKAWRKNSYISQVRISAMPVNWKNKLLLFCLKYRFWLFLKILKFYRKAINL